MAEIRKLDTILLQVTDMERALSFWRDGLGLPFLETAYGDGSTEARVGDVRVLLHPPFDEGASDLRRDVIVVQLEVDDADAWCEELRSRGIEPLRPPRDVPWGRWFTVVDPDGYRVAFVAR